MNKDKNREYNIYILTYDNDLSSLRHLPILVMLLGAISVFLGVFRYSIVTLEERRPTLVYICVQGCLIFVLVFIAILTLTAHENIITNLSELLTRQLSTLKSVSLTSRLGESWDSLQMRYSCCAVDSYRDYAAFAHNQKTQSIVPVSCCVMKNEEVVGLRPENVAQCQQDARLNVRDSVFIYTHGCLEPLSDWFTSYVYKLQTALWGAACSQALACTKGIWKLNRSIIIKTSIL